MFCFATRACASCVTAKSHNIIEIGESDGRLKIKINLNGQFKGHTDLYDDNGGIKETVYTA